MVAVLTVAEPTVSKDSLRVVTRQHVLPRVWLLQVIYCVLCAIAHNFGRSEGFPLAAYFIPGREGRGPGQIPKLFRRRRRRRPARPLRNPPSVITS